MGKKEKPLRAVKMQIFSGNRDNLLDIYVSKRYNNKEGIRGAIEVPVLQGSSMTL